MSKPRYDWWGYIKGMLRRYPHRVNENEKRAIEAAINQTLMLDMGKERVSVIDMVYFKKTHTLVGAAIKINCSERTAQRYHGDFIRAVASNYRCDHLL